MRHEGRGRASHDQSQQALASNRSSLFWLLAGEFVILNQHLMDDLIRLGLWDADMKNELVAANGSVQVNNLLLPAAFDSSAYCIPS